MQLTRGQRPHSYHEPNYHCPEANRSPHHSPMYHAHKCGTSRQPYAQRDPTPSIDIELRRSIATKSCQTMVEQSCRQQRLTKLRIARRATEAALTDPSCALQIQ